MATPRPRLQAIRLTDAAADRIKYVMANAQQPIVGVRVLHRKSFRSLGILTNGRALYRGWPR